MADLKPLPPSKLRLIVMEAVIRGEVFTYQFTAQSWWKKFGIADIPVSRQINAFAQHGLIRTDYAPKERGDRIWIEPTEAGREWLNEHTPRSTE